MSIIGALGSASTVNLNASITYNGCTFKSPRFRTRLRLVPEESADGRTVLCNTYRLTVRGIITDDESGYRAFVESTAGVSPGLPIDKRKTDQYNARSHLQKIQSRLSKKGGHLQIVGLGMDIDINNGNADTLFDVRFGPTTKVLEFNNIGQGVVWEILWECEFSIPQCSREGSGGHEGYVAGSGNSADVSWIDFPFTAQGQLEGLVWDVGYTIDQSGLTQRVITGEYSVAVTRASTVNAGAANKLVSSADEYRDLILPPIPEKFRRSQSSWRLSADRRKMSFIIVDTEMPGENDYPPGIIDMAVAYTVSVEGVILPMAPIVSCSFSGFCEVAKGYALGTAFDRIILIMQNRIDKARAALIAANPAAAGSNPVYITSVSITEELYGPRRISFGLSFMVMNLTGNAIFSGLITRTALFQPVTDDVGDPLYTWDAWHGGLLLNNHWSNRGVAQVEFDVEMDSIVGPCEPEQTYGDGDVSDLPLTVTDGGGSLVTECPPVGFDYLLWDVTSEFATQNDAAIHKPMGSPFPSGSYNGGAISELKTTYPEYAPLSGAHRPAETGLETTGSFLSGGSTIVVRFHVQAVRVGRPPELPTANLDIFHALYSQAKAIPGHSIVENQRGGKLGKCTVYRTNTLLEYTLTGLSSAADIQSAIGLLKDMVSITPSDLASIKLGGSSDTN